MAYRDFKFPDLESKLGIKVLQVPFLLQTIEPIKPSD